LASIDRISFCWFSPIRYITNVSATMVATIAATRNFSFTRYATLI